MHGLAEEFFQLIHEAFLLRVYLIAGNLCEFLQQLLLTGIEVLRSENLDADMLVAAAASPEMSHALPLHAEDGAGLCAGRYGQLYLAIESGDCHLVAEGSLNKGHRYLAEYIIAVTLEELVRLHEGIYIEVAVAAAAGTCSALAADSDTSAVVYAGRNLYLYLTGDPLMSRAVAIRAGSLDYLAGAAAAAAGAGIYHSAKGRILYYLLLSLTMAVRTGLR